MKLDRESIVKTDQNGAFIDEQNFGNNKIPLASETNDKDGFLNTPELECTMILEDTRDVSTNESTDTVGSCRILSCNMKKSKIIMECELPELLVCYKNDTYVVKDICVDEGMLVKGNNLVEIEKNRCVIVPSNGDKDGVVTKESDDDEFLSPDGSSQSSENDNINDSNEIKCISENPFDCDDTNYSPKVEIVDDDVSPEKVLSDNVPISPDFSKQKPLISFLLSSDYDGNEIEEQSNKIPFPEITCDIPISDLPCNSKYESSTNEIQNEQNSSLSNAESSKITHSGPMLMYSGSVSIRSESSSTRSFAFPILQPEWNSSPIKMAKADRRQYRKQGGWRQAFVCCRF